MATDLQFVQKRKKAVFAKLSKAQEKDEVCKDGERNPKGGINQRLAASVGGSYHCYLLNWKE